MFYYRKVIPFQRNFYSIITEIELLSYDKLSKEEELKIKNALGFFKRVNINETIKNITINIRKEKKLKLPDSLIVASAFYKNAVLVTNDKQLHNLNNLNVITLEELKDLN